MMDSKIKMMLVMWKNQLKNMKELIDNKLVGDSRMMMVGRSLQLKESIDEVELVIRICDE